MSHTAQFTLILPVTIGLQNRITIVAGCFTCKRRWGTFFSALRRPVKLMIHTCLHALVKIRRDLHHTAVKRRNTSSARLRAVQGLDQGGVATRARFGGRTKLRARRARHVFMEGQERESVYFIRRGIIKILKVGAEGCEHIVNILGKGQMFPYVAFF